MFRFSFLAAPILIMATTIASWAQDSASDPTLEQLRTMTRSAAEHYKAKEFAQSAEQIKQAEKLLEQMIAGLEKEYSRIERAHQLLVENGQTMPALKPFPGLRSTAADRTPATSESTLAIADQSTESSNQVSFSNDVVPVLAKHCGACHMRQAKGQFSAASYAALIKGSRKGPAVLPGKPEKSNLVTLVENHKMPPRSQGIPEPELQTLRDWISQGATFDGEDQNAKISIPGGPDQSRAPSGLQDDS
jgi:mono/diheme cytochrome c family protein